MEFILAETKPAFPSRFSVGAGFEPARLNLTENRQPGEY
jgi:hypothetical protein